MHRGSRFWKPRHHWRVVGVLGLAFVLMLTLIPSATTQAAPLPQGFQETVVLRDLERPTEVRFAPDGKIFVAEQSGMIKVWSSLTDETPTVFADLRTNVYNYFDRGLLGMALDPQFPQRPYVYVLYTHDAAIGGTAPLWGTPGATYDPCDRQAGDCIASGRLSRLQANGETMVGPERVLIEDWCQQFTSHSMGALHFDSSGALLISAGEGANFHLADYGQAGNTPLNPCGDPPVAVGGEQSPPHAEGGALRSQSVRRAAGLPVVLNGALLRVDPDTGAALPNNPLKNNPDPNAQRIVAYGLRNPFRFTLRPGTNEVWLGDVGWGQWEEIDQVANVRDGSVENFGWPCYEGPWQQSTWRAQNLTSCQNLYNDPGAETAPAFAYPEQGDVVAGDGCTQGGGSVTGLAFYPGGSYPQMYHGGLFFADYSRQCMWFVPKGTNGRPNFAQRRLFSDEVAYPVSLQVGPGGDLFYVDLGDNTRGGSVRRIQYFGQNQPPLAVAQATPQNGMAPLTVQFDGSQSSDPDGNDSLTYAWDLDGDGQYDDATGVQPTRTYTTAGDVIVRLRVTDNGGLSTLSEPLTISVGNTPPTPVIESPQGIAWRVNDVITFSGYADDAQEGRLPASALTWNWTLYHCVVVNSCHAHDLQTFVGVDSGTFTTVDHEYPTYLEVRLVARDANGLASATTLRLNPATVPVEFRTEPPGLTLAFGDSSAAAPFTRDVIVGGQNGIAAPEPQAINGVTYVWQSWSDGGDRSHSIAVDQPTTLVARFVPQTTATATSTTVVPSATPTATVASTVAPSATPTPLNTTTPIVTSTAVSESTATSTPVTATVEPTGTAVVEATVTASVVATTQQPQAAGYQVYVPVVVR